MYTYIKKRIPYNTFLTITKSLNLKKTYFYFSFNLKFHFTIKIFEILSLHVMKTKHFYPFLLKKLSSHIFFSLGIFQTSVFITIEKWAGRKNTSDAGKPIDIYPQPFIT
jgi:hypothetical protein